MQNIMQNGTDLERSQVMEYFSENQMKEAAYVLSTVPTHCFDPCVENFSRKYLDDKEKRCIQNCVHRFTTAMDRVGTRFAEENSDPNSPLNGAPAK